MRVFRLIVAAILLTCVLPRSLRAADPARRLIVIAPEAWRSSLAGFVAYKATLLPAEFRSLESILQTTGGVDDPEKLKRFLYEEWRSRRLGYALLVGDVDVMPVRFMVLDRVTPAAFDYAFYPTDLYYGDLAKRDGSFDDWNANKESFHARYFGEVRGEKNKDDAINYDGVDYLPEIAVGRWPVSEAAQARLVAAKAMTYEKGVLSDLNPSIRRAAFASVGGWVDSRGLMDRPGQEPGDAAIAPVVHVQLVRRDERAERKVFGQPPIAHHGEPLEQIDVGFFGREVDQIDHAIGVVLGDHFGCVLRIDQHNIQARLAQTLETVAQRGVGLVQRTIAQHGIAADLPQHQIRI